MTNGPMDALYREVVLDHHRHPRGAVALDDYDVQASGKNPSCGDEVTLQMRFDGDRISAVGVLSQGCAISTSSGSMMAELVTGLTLEEASEVAERFRRIMHGGEFPTDVDLGDLEALEGVARAAPAYRVTRGESEDAAPRALRLLERVIEDHG